MVKLVRIFAIGKYVFSFILVWYSFVVNEIAFSDIFDRECFFLLLCAFFINYAEYFLSSIRLYYLLITQKLFAPFIYVFKCSMASRFFENLLPSTVGGDLSKIYLLKSYFSHKKLLSIVVISLVDRAISLGALFLVSTLTLILFFPIVYELPYFSFFASISLGGTLVFYLGIYLGMKNIFLPNPFFKKLFKMPKLGVVLKESFLVLAFFKRKKRYLIKIIILSIFIQCISLISLFLVIWSDNQSIDIVKAFFILPLAFITNIFGVMGGVGVGTTSIGFCLENFFSIKDAYALVFLFQSIQILSKIPCIVFCLGRISAKER